jgi:hypothetical protein
MLLLLLLLALAALVAAFLLPLRLLVLVPLLLCTW